MLFSDTICDKSVSMAERRNALSTQKSRLRSLLEGKEIKVLVTNKDVLDYTKDHATIK